MSMENPIAKDSLSSFDEHEIDKYSSFFVRMLKQKSSLGCSTSWKLLPIFPTDTNIKSETVTFRSPPSARPPRHVRLSLSQESIIAKGFDSPTLLPRSLTDRHREDVSLNVHDKV